MPQPGERICYDKSDVLRRWLAETFHGCSLRLFSAGYLALGSALSVVSFGAARFNETDSQCQLGSVEGVYEPLFVEVATSISISEANYKQFYYLASLSLDLCVL